MESTGETDPVVRVSALWRVGSWFAMAFAFKGVIAITLAMLLHRPQFIEVFEDLDTELPGITIAMLRIPGLLVALAAALTIGLLLFAQLACRDRKTLFLVHLLVCAAALLLLALYVLAAFLPVMKVMQSVM